MLPNRMQLSKTVEEQLKRLKSQTGITPNISARLAFYKSVESAYRYDPSIEYSTDGNLILDKITWLGKSQQVTELLLQYNYPGLEPRKLQQAWAAHVEHGISSLRNTRSLINYLKELK